MSSESYDDIITIQVSVHVDPTQTYTTVTAEFADGYRAVGTSKRNPDDDVNAELGFTLAAARAFRDIADYYETSGETIQ